MLAVLTVPMAIQAISDRGRIVSEGEARILSPAAGVAAHDAGLAGVAAQRRPLFRGSLWPAHRTGSRARALRYAVDLPSDLRVLIGRDNWLFLNGDGTIEQATGKILREPEIAKFADRAAALRQALPRSSAPAGRQSPRTVRPSTAAPPGLGGAGAAGFRVRSHVAGARRAAACGGRSRPAAGGRGQPTRLSANGHPLEQVRSARRL